MWLLFSSRITRVVGMFTSGITRVVGIFSSGITWVVGTFSTWVGLGVEVTNVMDGVT